MPDVVVKEVACRSALGRCGLPGFSYSINPYKGCEHGCLYCYSPSVTRERRPWGSFVDVRINMPTVLAKELRRKPRGAVWFGSVCDAYQPVEAKHELTRKCLQLLLRVDWPVSLLTKSALSIRDFDLMTSFSDFELGYSIAFADDALRRSLEPGASSIEERLEAMRIAAKRGLKPWAFIAPILPGLTDRAGEIERLIGKLADAGVERVGFDPFRPKPGIWPRMGELLRSRPDLAESFRRAAREEDYYTDVARLIGSECQNRGIKVVV